MKRHKRDREVRAYNRGYQAGVDGRSRDFCPFEQVKPRQSWLNGWREGREHMYQGMQGVANIHHLKNVV